MHPILEKLLTDPSIQKTLRTLRGLRRDLSRRLVLIDFSEGLATVVECRIKGDCFDLTRIDVTVLPEDATEKGCPSDPAAMAELIKGVIREQGIVARRCSVVMPAIAFTTVTLCVDAEMSIDQALKELGESGSQLQLPFPRKHADIDLIDNTSTYDKKAKTHHSYMLVATQRNNTERVVECCKAAELELQLIDCGLVAPLRLFAERIKDLSNDEEILHLNLSPGVTSCTLVWVGGAQKVMRMAPVRTFPAIQEKSEEYEYFPISPDDIISLIRDIKRHIKESSKTVKEITLSGTGSAHKGIEELIGEALEIKTSVINPLDEVFLGNVNLPEEINSQVLIRIVGMAKRFFLAEYNQREVEIPSRALSK